MRQASFPFWFGYSPGLGTAKEAVISSHFMHRLCTHTELTIYDGDCFAARSIEIDPSKLDEILIPNLLSASRAFAAERAEAAKRRARDNYRLYGLTSPKDAGTAQFITELMFDRQFQRGGRTSCNRVIVCARVTNCLAAGRSLAMLIPALPFKISSPLKNRGTLPDLAEVNFLLVLYEIILAIELLYEEGFPARSGPSAKFTVVSDGSRFEALVREPPGRVAAYRVALLDWVRRLGLEGHIEIVDYGRLLQTRLSAEMFARKQAIRLSSGQAYADAMMPLFDPSNIAHSLAQATLIEPDPEVLNSAGRFASLFKSLVYTINYATLERFSGCSADRQIAIYRELTSQLFYSCSPIVSDGLYELDDGVSRPAPDPELLRGMMLREVWEATIAYLAEIKSDRDLEADPITTCLPDHIRWTIHAKPGQLCLLAPSTMGMPVQAWAGSATFKKTGNERVKLCALPVLALESAGAIPVLVGGHSKAMRQPLFYIYPDIEFTGLDPFLEMLAARLTRRRVA